jgi:hypothetical protein
MFLLSLLHAIKQLDQLDNLYFRVEIQGNLRRKRRRLAAREVQLITYPNTSSASPALSGYRGNSNISLVDFTSASEVRQTNGTDPVTVVQQKGLSTYNTFFQLKKHAVLKKSENYIILLLYSFFIIILEINVLYLFNCINF